MRYYTTIEESNGVLRIAIHEPVESGSRTIALLACLLAPSTTSAIAEAARIAVEALAVRGH